MTQAHDPLKVTILGFTVPDEVLETEGVAPSVSPQTRNFAFALQNALQAAGCLVSLVSTLPILNYPGERKVLCRSKKFEMNGSSGQLLGFINLVTLKHLTRFVSCLRSGKSHIKKSQADVILIHGVHSPFLWFGRYLKRSSKVAVIPILTDPPSVILSTDNAPIRWLKRLDTWLIHKSLSGMSGVIALTDDLGETFAPSSPRLVMEGILNPRLLDRTTRRAPTNGPFIITYAGSLLPEYGVRSLVEAVQSLPDRDVILRICGSGPLEGWLDEIQKTDPRIKFLGILPFEEVLAQFESSNLLVNPRPVNQDFVRYSFPSKIIEYMASSRPVLTTRLPGIPETYGKFIWFADSDSVVGLVSAIKMVADMPSSILEGRADAGRDFVVSVKSPQAQGERIRNFIESVRTEHGDDFRQSGKYSLWRRFTSYAAGQTFKDFVQSRYFWLSPTTLAFSIGSKTYARHPRSFVARNKNLPLAQFCAAPSETCLARYEWPLVLLCASTRASRLPTPQR